MSDERNVPSLSPPSPPEPKTSGTLVFRIGRRADTGQYYMCSKAASNEVVTEREVPKKEGKFDILNLSVFRVKISRTKKLSFHSYR